MTIRTALLAALTTLAVAGPAWAQQTPQAQSAAPAPETQDPQKQFLAENAKKKGWKTTQSGLQYKIVKEAPFGAKSPKSSDAVLVHYEGRLIDGKVFDSSYKRGEPISFPLNRVIPGWTEGVGMMRVGETRELAIPAELAYGQRGVPGTIPPGSTLLFTVELLEILPPEAMPPR